MPKTASRTLLSADGLSISEAEAFERVRAELEAVPLEKLVLPTINIQLAAAYVYSVAARDLQDERRVRFEYLAESSLWATEVLTSLPYFAKAAWYCRRHFDEVDALEGYARLPEGVETEARDIRGRMIRVLEYHVGDQSFYRNRIALIRSGSGHQDLANDLQSLAEIYAEPEVQLVVRQDPRWYQESDPDDALRLAGQIFESLGIKRPQVRAQWSQITKAVWVRLSEGYQEHAAAGRFIFRDEENTAETYPNLISTIRSSPKRTQPKEEEPSEPSEPQSDPSSAPTAPATPTPATPTPAS